MNYLKTCLLLCLGFSTLAIASSASHIQYLRQNQGRHTGVYSISGEKCVLKISPDTSCYDSCPENYDVWFSRPGFWSSAPSKQLNRWSVVPSENAITYIHAKRNINLKISYVSNSKIVQYEVKDDPRGICVLN
jgi:hypothetical protein